MTDLIITQPVPVRLFAENSHGLVSLADVVKAFQPEQVLKAARGIWVTAAIIAPIGDPRREATLTLSMESIESCLKVCESIGLSVSALKAKSALELFAQLQHRVDSEKIDRMGQIVIETMCEEMSLRKYFEVAPDKAAMFSEGSGVHPFGDRVSEAFPSTTYDAIEAGRCYALGRDTACVFHLMRVLEIGLGVLAKQFGLASDYTNWEIVISQVERAIRDIDKDANRPVTWKDDREFYSQCASHFRILKDAWRNYTIHVRGKYNSEEALDILTGVRGFMQKIAGRLSEKP